MEAGQRYSPVINVRDVREYIGRHKLVAFDFETAPDDTFRDEDKAALDPAKSHICGCSFSVEPGTGIYVPIQHQTGNNCDRDDFMGFLREFLQNAEITKVAHNIAFESQFAYAEGIVIQPPVYDTICAAQMTLNGPYTFRKLGESGLKALAKELFDEELPTFTAVTAGHHFDELNAQDAETVRYGAADSDYALRLYYTFEEWFGCYLPKHGYIVREIESPVAVYLGLMKKNGIPFDSEILNEKKKEIDAELVRIQGEIKTFVGDVEMGRDCNTKAFRDWLFKAKGFPALREKENGGEALDDMAILLLKEWCDENCPEMSWLFELIPELRKLTKTSATYIDGYAKHINNATGCVHPDMYALSTATGRLNCRNPNAQNMPRKTNDPSKFRDCVRAPEGQLIISLDFSQIELRVGAFYCRDEKMLDTYRNGGDIHAQTTSVIYGIGYEEALDKCAEGYKEHRTVAKNVNFGTFYGLYPKGLQTTLKGKAGIDKTLSECEAIIANIKAGYRGLSSWQLATKEEAARYGYSESWLGRRRYLPQIRSKTWKEKSSAERCALNTPIQGTAADILKIAMVRILKGLPERPWLKPILQIHDELVFLIPEEKLNEAVGFVRDCMEESPFPEFDLPLVAEAAAGKTFGSMTDI